MLGTDRRLAMQFLAWYREWHPVIRSDNQVGPMEVITGIELIVAQVGVWKPNDVAYLRRVSFESVDAVSYDLVLLLLLQPRPPLSAGWPDPKEPFWEIEIEFKRVRNLALTVCGPWDIQTPGFSLEDVRDRQWEGINVMVCDYEQLNPDGISFVAKSAHVRSCRRAAFPPNSPEVWRQYPGAFGRTVESES